MSLCLLSLVVVLLTPDAQAAGKTWYVDDDYVECPNANFSTIQAAIDNASDYDVIIVCNGSYNESINIDKPLVIHSQNGSDVTFIHGGGANRAVSVNASGVTFGADGQGFNVSNNGTGYGIAMYTGSLGIGDVDMTGNSIVGNVVHNCSRGMRIDNQGGGGTDIHGITVLNNTVYNCSTGIYFDNDEAGDLRANNISGNTVYNCSEYGIYFYNDENSGDIYGNTVEGNEVYGCNDSGIKFYNDENENSGEIYGNDVEYNTVYNCSGYGIYFNNSWSEGNIRGNNVLNNTVHGCSRAGISFENNNEGMDEGDIYQNVVEGNTVYLCDDGIEFENEWESDGDIYYNDVLDNEVYLCDTCIEFENDGDSDGEIYGNDVEGNTVYDCEEGIEFENDEGSDGDIEDNDVLGNTVYNCSDAGIGFGSFGGYEDIEGNTVEDNTVYNCPGGIVFLRLDSGTISGNTVFNNTVHHCEWGIDLWEELLGEPGPGGLYSNTVEDNTVHNCTEAGIDLWSEWIDSVVGNSVLNNTVYNCWGGEFAAGIMLFSGEDGNLSGNTIEGNEVFNSFAGIGALSVLCGNISGNTIAGNTVNNTSVGIIMESQMCMGPAPPPGFESAGGPGVESGAYGGHRLPDIGGFTLPQTSRDGEGGIVGEESGQPPEPGYLYPGIFDNTVAGNTVYNYEEAGIALTAFAGGWNYRNTVEDNTVSHSWDGGELTAGIALVAAEDGLIDFITVEGNTVFDSPAGILLLDNGGGHIFRSTIEGNTVYWAEACIALDNWGMATIERIDIRDNVLYNQSLADEEGFSQMASIIMLGCEFINVSNNSIAYSADAGLLIDSSQFILVDSNRIFNNSEGIALLDAEYVFIARNDILNNSGAGPLTGIYISDGEASDPGDILIHCNNIVGNGEYGIYNYDETPFNASWNWWGDPGGPGDGDANDVHNMFVEPWLDAPTTTSVAGLALNATAVPSMVSVYDWYNLFGGAPSDDIYSLGPSYTDIIVEFNCSENPCAVCNASVNLSALLLDILPAGFEEDYVADWSEDGQDIWEDWMDDLSQVWMYLDGYGSNGDEVCFADYELWLELLFFPDEGDALAMFFEEEYEEGEGWDLFMTLIFEDLRLGQVQVPVDLWPCIGPPETVYAPLTVVDFQLPLDEGWNLRSAPLKLDSNWSTIGDVYAMGDGLNGMEAFITWDSEAGMWVEPGPAAALDPWYAYYIKMAERDQMGFVVDRQGPPPLTDKRQLHAGWNLVGIVPDLTDINESLPEAYPFPAMDPWQALITVGGNWSQAVGIEEFLEYTEYFDYRWIELEKPSYDKYFWQEPFTAYPNGSGSWWGPPFVSPGGGFWVYMDNAAMLEAIRYTPLPWDQWLEEPPD